MLSNGLLLKQIKQVLLQLGMSPTLMGFEYLAECIYLCVEDMNRIHDLILSVYCPVAEYNHTTYPRVERNIRHLIKVFSDRNRIPELNALLHVRLYKIGDYPTNGELIAYLAEYIRLHYDFDTDTLT